MNFKARGRRLSDKEESQIRGQLRRGDTPEAVCERWGIKLQRLRRINCGPLKCMGYAIERYAP